MKPFYEKVCLYLPFLYSFCEFKLNLSKSSEQASVARRACSLQEIWEANQEIYL